MADDGGTEKDIISDLQAVIAEMTSKNANLLADIAELRGSKMELEAEVESLREVSTERLSRLLEVEGHAKQNTEEIAELQNWLQVEEQCVKDLRAELEAARRLVDENNDRRDLHRHQDEVEDNLVLPRERKKKREGSMQHTARLDALKQLDRDLLDTEGEEDRNNNNNDDDNNDNAAAAADESSKYRLPILDTVAGEEDLVFDNCVSHHARSSPAGDEYLVKEAPPRRALEITELLSEFLQLLRDMMGDGHNLSLHVPRALERGSVLKYELERALEESKRENPQAARDGEKEEGEEEDFLRHPRLPKQQQKLKAWMQGLQDFDREFDDAGGDNGCLSHTPEKLAMNCDPMESNDCSVASDNNEDPSTPTPPPPPPLLLPPISIVSPQLAPVVGPKEEATTGQQEIEIAELRETVRQLEDKLAEAQSQAQYEWIKLEEERKKIEDHWKRSQELKEVNDSKNNNNNDNNGNDARQRLEELEQELKIARTTIRALHDANRDRNGNNNNNDATPRSSSDDNNEAKSPRTPSSRILGNHVIQIDLLRTQLAAKTAEVERLTTTISNSKNSVEALTLERNSLVAELEDYKQKYQEKISTRESCKVCNVVRTTLDEWIQLMREKAPAVASYVESIEHDVHTQRELVDILRVEKDSLILVKNKLEAQVEELKIARKGEAAVEVTAKGSEKNNNNSNRIRGALRSSFSKIQGLHAQVASLRTMLSIAEERISFTEMRLSDSLTRCRVAEHMIQSLLNGEEEEEKEKEEKSSEAEDEKEEEQEKAVNDVEMSADNRETTVVETKSDDNEESAKDHDQQQQQQQAATSKEQEDPLLLPPRQQRLLSEDFGEDDDFSTERYLQAEAAMCDQLHQHIQVVSRSGSNSLENKFDFAPLTAGFHTDSPRFRTESIVSRAELESAGTPPEVKLEHLQGTKHIKVDESLTLKTEQSTDSNVNRSDSALMRVLKHQFSQVELLELLDAATQTDEKDPSFVPPQTDSSRPFIPTDFKKQIAELLSSESTSSPSVSILPLPTTVSSSALDHAEAAVDISADSHFSWLPEEIHEQIFTLRGLVGHLESLLEQVAQKSESLATTTTTEEKTGRLSPASFDRKIQFLLRKVEEHALVQRRSVKEEVPEEARTETSFVSHSSPRTPYFSAPQSPIIFSASPPPSLNDHRKYPTTSNNSSPNTSTMMLRGPLQFNHRTTPTRSPNNPSATLYPRIAISSPQHSLIAKTSSPIGDKYGHAGLGTPRGAYSSSPESLGCVFLKGK